MVASATATWVIVIVVVCALTFMLSAVALAGRRPYSKHPRMAPMMGPVVGGTHVAEGGRSVAPDRDAPPVFTNEEIRQLDRSESQARPEVPVQRVPAMAPKHVMPLQRMATHDEREEQRS